MKNSEAARILTELAVEELHVWNEQMVEAFKVAMLALAETAWHDLREDPQDMPQEHESIFNKFFGTERWNEHMFRTCSDCVDVTFEYPDGTRSVETAKTRDGKWSYDRLVFQDANVIGWRPRVAPMQDR